MCEVDPVDHVLSQVYVLRFKITSDGGERCRHSPPRRAYQVWLERGTGAVSRSYERAGDTTFQGPGVVERRVRRSKRESYRARSPAAAVSIENDSAIRRRAAAPIDALRPGSPRS